MRALATVSLVLDVQKTERLAHDGEESPQMDPHLVQQCTNVRNAHGYLTSLANQKKVCTKPADGHSFRRLYNLGYLRRCGQRSDETSLSKFYARQLSNAFGMTGIRQA